MKNILSLLIILFLFFSCTPIKKDKVNAENIPGIDTLKPQTLIPELDNELIEISGLLIYDELFWGFNDSGGKNKIYGFNLNGEIEKEIEIKDAKNNDWESITQDDKNIYIGDFGNNMGSRENLCIYKIKKKDIQNKKTQKIDSQKIEIKYAEQTQFIHLPQTTVFDCEAMTEFKGSLYIFSKNWKEYTTAVYKIPTKKGKYSLSAIDTFNVNGLITGADVSPDKTQLALVGYKNYQSFIWLFSDFTDDNFFKGSSKYFHLHETGNAQTEGICYRDNKTLLVSCEQTKAFKQQVFLFDISNLNNGSH
jgi:hypothetical protein